MTQEEKIARLVKAIETIREATYAEFQLEAEEYFDRGRHACPLCRRASTARHLKDNWALIQATAAQALREIDQTEENSK